MLKLLLWVYSPSQTPPNKQQQNPPQKTKTKQQKTTQKTPNTALKGETSNAMSRLASPILCKTAKITSGDNKELL